MRRTAALALSAWYVFWSVETKRADVPAVNTMSLAARDLEDVRTVLYAIQALAQALGLDPAHEFDRTALAALIEREASRASGIVDALINRESD